MKAEEPAALVLFFALVHVHPPYPLPNGAALGCGTERIICVVLVSLCLWWLFPVYSEEAWFPRLGLIQVPVHTYADPQRRHLDNGGSHRSISQGPLRNILLPSLALVGTVAFHWHFCHRMLYCL